MSLNKESDTAHVYLLRVWDLNWLQHAIFLDATVDPALLIDCAEPHPLFLTREFLRPCCDSGDPGRSTT